MKKLSKHEESVTPSLYGLKALKQGDLKDMLWERGMIKTTVMRLLGTFVQEGIIKMHSHGVYRGNG